MIRLLFAALLFFHVNGSCPPSNYYGPCLCSIDTNGFTALTCSDITDVSELLDALANVTDTYLASVSITNSPLLTDLPNDLFGDISVGAFYIRNTGISDPQSGIIGTPASSVLTEYYLRANGMTALKGEAILGLTVLSLFQVTIDSITSLSTPLVHSSVTEIDFSFNSIEQISESFFKLPPAISSVDLSFNSLRTENLIPGSLEFADEVSFLHLDLSFNELSEGVPPDALQETIPCQLILSGNGIENFDNEHYSSILYNMYFKYGTDQNCYIFIATNPLNCNCSMLWLVESIAKEMVIGGTCSDGRLVSDLTLDEFVDC